MDGCLPALTAAKPLSTLLPLALQAWNAGQQAGAAEELQQAAVLLGVCGELYAALPAPGLASLHKQKVGVLAALLPWLLQLCARLVQRPLVTAKVFCCPCHTLQMAFLMAAAAACEVFESQSSAQADAAGAPAEAGGTGSRATGSLNLARSFMQQARSAAAGLLTQQALLGGEAAAAAGAAGDPKSDVYLLLLVSANVLAD